MGLVSLRPGSRRSMPRSNRPKPCVTGRLLACGAAVFAAATLAACASSPGTIGSDSHGLAIEEFFTKDPHDLRLALRSDDRSRRGPIDPSIVLRATVGTRALLCYVLALVPVDPSAPGEAALEKAPGRRRWYVFGLSKDGIATFEQARGEVHGSPSDQGNLNFEFVLDGVIAYADDPQGSPLRVDVAVDRRPGYFTMSAERTIRPPATTKSGTATCGVNPVR